VHVWCLRLGSRWGGSTSYLVEEECEWARLKYELQQELVRLGLWDVDPSSKDQDAPNRTPHVQLVARHEDPALMEHRRVAIQGRAVPLNEQTITVETNTVMVHVGDGRHVTLAYKRDLASTDAKRELVRQAVITAIRKVLSSHRAPAAVNSDNNNNNHPPPPPPQLEPPSLERQCCICLDGPVETCLVPCGHLCLCTGCVDSIQSKCPVCRQHVDKWVKTYSS
jgi:hypothetical protein